MPGKYMVDTAKTTGRNFPASATSEAGAAVDEIEVTPAMIEAGATDLGQAYDRPYDRRDPYSYEAFVADQVFRAMVQAMATGSRG
jgi:hypothetical protein